MVYTNESALLVSNAKNILTNEGISVFIKNEHSATGGHVNFAHMELWVNQDGDHQKALDVLASLKVKANAKDWQCSNCNEENDASFDICWKCSSEAPQ
jgi:hypothetical protein